MQAYHDVDLVLELSTDSYAEIRQKLIEGGGGDSIHFDGHPRGGELIGLNRVAICEQRPRPKRAPRRRMAAGAEA